MMRLRMSILKEFRWHPEIGDPTFMGWFTVAMYAVAALLSLRAWLRTKDRIWLLTALGMAVLCVNKQMDLQSLFTDIGRVASHHMGWYKERRQFQKWFILGVLTVAGTSGAWFLWRHHAFWMRHQLLSAGVLFLMTFILVRAISFHHFDQFLKTMHFGVKMNWALELGGILLIALAAKRK